MICDPNAFLIHAVFFQFQVALSSVAYEMYVMEEFLLDDMRGGGEGRSQGLHLIIWKHRARNVGGGCR